MKFFFGQDREPIRFDLPDAAVSYYPRFFSPEKADELYRYFLDNTRWQQDHITLFGKTHPQPRLTALYGNEGKPYSYSGITMQPHPWNPALAYVKDEIGEVCAEPFTTVLLNLYRNGQDSNGWHADNEKELGRQPVIASVSLGAERPFQLQHNTDRALKQKILLEHGSLLIMSGNTQHAWKHQLPKMATAAGPRINLTFRTIR